MDDGVPCRDEESELKQALDEVGIILERIGFSLKCVTTSGPVSYTHLALPTNREV